MAVAWGTWYRLYYISVSGPVSTQKQILINSPQNFSFVTCNFMTPVVFFLLIHPRRVSDGPRQWIYTLILKITLSAGRLSPWKRLELPLDARWSQRRNTSYIYGCIAWIWTLRFVLTSVQAGVKDAQSPSVMWWLSFVCRRSISVFNDLDYALLRSAPTTFDQEVPWRSIRRAFLITPSRWLVAGSPTPS